MYRSRSGVIVVLVSMTPGAHGWRSITVRAVRILVRSASGKIPPEVTTCLEEGENLFVAAESPDRADWCVEIDTRGEILEHR